MAINRLFRLALSLICAVPCLIHAQNIYTIAGTGIRGYAGDGGPALEARLNAPQGIHRDAAGTLYIADTMNHRIRKVTADGVISTIAGNGTSGVSGDGGAANQARLAYPTAVIAAASGALFIADTGNNRIRRITPSGVITTFAGTAPRGFSGDGRPALIAAFNNPRGLALDSAGTLYIADTMNHRIRKVAADGFIATIAGNGTPGFTGDDGPATEALLNAPENIHIDADGILYIADTGNNRIRKIAGNGIISTIAGNGARGRGDPTATALQSPLYNPQAVFAAQQLIFADSGNHRLHRLTGASGLEVVAGTGHRAYTGDNGPAVQAALYQPEGIHVTGTDIYLADSGNHVIRLITDQPTAGVLPGNSRIDFDADGQVNLADLFVFAGRFGSTAAAADWDPRFDLVANNKVDFNDFWRFAEIFQRRAQ